MTVTRSAIAAALSTVAGVEGSALPPPTRAAGQGWPVWRNSEVLNGCSILRTHWEVFVILPNGDPGVPIEAGDPLVVPLAEAIHSTTLTVEDVRPWSDPETGNPGLQFVAFD